MRFLIAILLIGLLSLLAEQYWAWWIIAVVSFAVTLFVKMRPGRSFWAGFLGVGLFWLFATTIKDNANHHILSQRLAELFHLSGSAMFITVTVIIGALVGGIAGLAGSYTRRMF